MKKLLKQGKHMLFASLLTGMMSSSLTHAAPPPVNIAGTDVTGFAYVDSSAPNTTLTPTSGTNSLFGNLLEGDGFNSAFNKITLTSNTNDGARQQLRNNAAVDFAAVDAPMSVSQHTTYMSSPAIISAGHQRPVQVPSIASSVAIIFNNPDIATDYRPNLTSVQLAKIFSGQYTNWNQLGLNLPSRAITVIARTGDNGNSFGLVNHLNAVGGLSVGKFFSVKPNFEDAVATAKTSSFSFVGAFSDTDAISKLNMTPGAIAYISGPLVSRSSFLRVATIQQKHPVTDMPTTINISSSNLLTDTLLQGTLTSGTQAGRIIYAPINNQPEDALETVLTIRPESYANPSSGYPIMNISYLVGHLAGNKQPINQLVFILRAPIIPAFRSTVPTTISVNTIPNKGYAWLNGTALAVQKASAKMQ